jgi:hypothetical protein
MSTRFNLSALSRHRSAKFALASLIAVVAIVLVTFTARARWMTKSPYTERGVADAQPTHKTVSPLQGKPFARSRLHSRLSFQPEADRMRRRLGQRFLAPGREMATLVGTLKLGAQQYTVRIIRNQEENGENVTVGLNGRPASLTWNNKDGAKVGNAAAAGDQRELLERIALDSPDQFVLAQLRGASYRTVAQQARPAEAGGSDSYRGPLWDIVRIGEPPQPDRSLPQSRWRLYHINATTGLIGKVVSEEHGQTIAAEISGWVNQGGETMPTRITWKRESQMVMELNITNTAHNPKQ